MVTEKLSRSHRLNDYFTTQTQDSDPIRAYIRDNIPGLYAGVAYGFDHLALFYLDNTTQIVRPSLNHVSTTSLSHLLSTTSIADEPINSPTSSASSEDFLPEFQFGPGALDMRGYGTLCAIVERNVRWLDGEEALGECLVTYYWGEDVGMRSLNPL